MNVVLEIFLLSFQQGDFFHKVVYVNVEQTAHSPDELVWRTAREAGYDEQNHFRHSTSWRYNEGRKEIILTYIVFEEGIMLQSSIATSVKKIDDPVLKHALRHLNFLVGNGDTKNISHQVKNKLKHLGTDLAGQINPN